MIRNKLDSEMTCH